MQRLCQVFKLLFGGQNDDVFQEEHFFFGLLKYIFLLLILLQLSPIFHSLYSLLSCPPLFPLTALPHPIGLVHGLCM